MAEMPVIRREYCNGCGLCANVCSCNAIQIVGKTVVISEKVECSWCTQCEAVCPTGAIQCAFVIVVEEGQVG